MDYFEVSVDGRNYLIKPSLMDHGNGATFSTIVHGQEIVFIAGGDGLTATKPNPQLDADLLDRIAQAIDSYFM